MKKTGRILYISGQVTQTDIVVPAGGGSDYGLVPIWENERRGYGYLVRFVGSFPGLTTPAQRGNSDYLLTTYSARDLERLTQTAAGINYALQIIGAQGGMPPAENDRVLACYSGDNVNKGVDRYHNGIIKRDALVVQSISLGINSVEGAPITYYIELEEYELSDDEMVLALLQESSQNVAELTIT